MLDYSLEKIPYFVLLHTVVCKVSDVYSDALSLYFIFYNEMYAIGERYFISNI